MIVVDSTNRSQLGLSFTQREPSLTQREAALSFTVTLKCSCAVWRSFYKVCSSERGKTGQKLRQVTKSALSVLNKYISICIVPL